MEHSNIILILLIGFCALGAFDGIYYHIIKYKLHLHPETALEHKIHTLRGLVFFCLGILLFAINSSGPSLLIACALVAVDIFLEIVDIKVEKNARKNIGGIDSNETVLHVFASACKFSAAILVLMQKPGDAFSLSAPFLLSSAIPSQLQYFAIAMAGGSLAATLYSAFHDLKSFVLSRARPSVNKVPQRTPAA